ncbi:MAG: cell division protein FtsW [Hyphomicrobiales bacterium]|nr:cell division protein FtsW [Hyphomicrobiales bacterium]
MISRADRSFFSDWLWTVDRFLIGALGLLMIFGIVLGMAGSPPVAERLHLSTFHFVNKQVEYLLPAIGVLLVASFLSPRQVRRAALAVFIGAMALIFAALLFGAEVKGARRWIFGVQPSEFVKPAFAVLAAWAFSEGAKRRDVPANWLAILILPATVVPLMMQPDFGQTMLISLVWAALFFMAGLHWLWVAGIGGVGATAVALAYRFVPHVRARILRFVEPQASGGGVTDTFQVDTARDSFIAGGWFGKGPGEGTLKRILPDSHTDFIFAVTGEEFGIIACIVIVSLFAFIVLRGLSNASRNDDPFCRFAAAGLTMLFGVQSCINLAVNLHLMPAKGMTLPFISYGGSSLISLALGMGFLIAVTRKRPRTETLHDMEAAPESAGA